MNSNRSRLEALIYNLLLKSGPLDAHTISLIVEAEEKTVKNVLKELVSNRIVMRIKDTEGQMGNRLRVRAQKRDQGDTGGSGVSRRAIREV